MIAVNTATGRRKCLTLHGQVVLTDPRIDGVASDRTWVDVTDALMALVRATTQLDNRGGEDFEVPIIGEQEYLIDVTDTDFIDRKYDGVTEGLDWQARRVGLFTIDGRDLALYRVGQ